MNMFEIIRERNMRELEELRSNRKSDPTYNRIAEMVGEEVVEEEVPVVVEEVDEEVIEKVAEEQPEVVTEKEEEVAPKPAKAKREKK